MALTVRPAPVEWRRGRIDVAGVVPTQGSKTYGATKAGKGFGRENNAAELKAFRAAVLLDVALYYPGLSKLEPIIPRGPVALRVLLRMPLTKAQEKRWTEDGPTVWHDVAPDSDKQLRAIMDALTEAHVWADDGQACRFDIAAIRHPDVGATIEWAAL